MGSPLSSRLIAEALGTFLLVFIGTGAVMTNTINPTGASGLISIAFAFGFALMIVVYAIGHISGGSVNPARSLAPAIVSGNLDGLWIYLTAPFIGGIAGAFAYAAIRGPEETLLSAEQGSTTEPHRAEV